MRTYFLAFLVACGGSSGSTDVDANQQQPDSSDNGIAVVFNYTPAWDGVVSVDVLGAFGNSDDWTTPLVSLTSTGGAWSGTAMLPAGTYPYVFHVIGDAAAGAKAGTYDRYAVDPTATAYSACPMASPTYSAEMNPCSQISVPYVASAMSHVTGRAVVDGSPQQGMIVLIERQESDTHHFFANRSTTGSDGTYDFAVAAGSYRIQVLHPDYLATTDAMLAPSNLMRRAITGHFAVSADVAVSDAEMGFHDYALFAPTPTSTLPTQFTFTSGSNVRLEVYGYGNEIGDPWFNSTATQTGHSTFDGTFNTGKQKTPMAEMGKQYMWGIEEPHAADSSGIAWLGQTMVFPITWSTGS